MKNTHSPVLGSVEAVEAFNVLANVLGLSQVSTGAGVLAVRKKEFGLEAITLTLQGGNVLRAERRRGSSSVVITSEATMDGAYGVFCELAPRIAAFNERYVRVLNHVEDADVDPGDVVTCIRYQYRDGDNYKQLEVARFAGPAARDSVNVFLAMLESSEGSPSIIPGQIGLDDLQGRFANGWSEDSDHPFHEVTAVELVDVTVMSEGEAVTPQSFDDFTRAMFITLGNAGGWDQNYRPDCAPVSSFDVPPAWPGGD